LKANGSPGLDSFWKRYSVALKSRERKLQLATVLKCTRERKLQLATVLKCTRERKLQLATVAWPGRLTAPFVR
jgi:hypothetical protein